MDTQPPASYEASPSSAPSLGTTPEKAQQPLGKKEAWIGTVAGMLTIFWLVYHGLNDSGSPEPGIKNTPAAIEKLVRESLHFSEGFDHITIEPTGADGSSSVTPQRPYHSINIAYHSRSMLSNESTFSSIQLTMEDAYREILKHSELHISAIDITAQLELQDSFGHSHGWGDVYQTRLGPQTIPRINRNNLGAVSFREIWDVEFTHRIFSQQKGK